MRHPSRIALESRPARLRQPGPYALGSGATAARPFLAMTDRPTGIVCASDEMAIGFITTIGSAGVRCPDDVSVVGFDDIEFAEFYAPTLTTVRQPRHDPGVTGARALHGGTTASERRVILPAGLVIRESSAPSPTSSCAMGQRTVARAASR